MLDQARLLLIRLCKVPVSLCAGGVKIKYITGKGLHSANGAKIKPSLMEMLADHNIPFVEGPGYVIATFAPA